MEKERISLENATFTRPLPSHGSHARRISGVFPLCPHVGKVIISVGTQEVASFSSETWRGGTSGFGLALADEGELHYLSYLPTYPLDGNGDRNAADARWPIVEIHYRTHFHVRAVMQGGGLPRYLPT